PAPAARREPRRGGRIRAGRGGGPAAGPAGGARAAQAAGWTDSCFRRYAPADAAQSAAGTRSPHHLRRMDPRTPRRQYRRLPEPCSVSCVAAGPARAGAAGGNGIGGSAMATHEVFNQVPPLAGHDVADEPVLLDGLEREGAGWAEPEVRELGRLAGTEQAQEWGRLANEYPPVLRTHDRYGHRIDEVEFHPAWHQLMTVAVENGLHAAPWASDRPGAHVARAAKFFIWSQVEAGHGCPISMTYSAVAALRHSPELRAEWEPRLTSCAYDFGLRPPAEKRGILAGMAMTEKQGGSDVRSNTTKAEPLGDGTYALTGHKWFNSAPMCDIFFVLAQAPGGLSCFLLPSVLPDGTRNAMRLIRLKDKLGNRSNASAEVEYEGAIAYLVGEEGRGVRTIIEMVNMTRLDCVIGSAAGMRFGLTQALHHAKHRRAFGKLLIDQPLMRAVLADLALESEAATTLMLRLAGATDRAIRGDEAEALFRRAALAAAKYWVTKRGPV